MARTSRNSRIVLARRSDERRTSCSETLSHLVETLLPLILSRVVVGSRRRARRKQLTTIKSVSATPDIDDDDDDHDSVSSA